MERFRFWIGALKERVKTNKETNGYDAFVCMPLFNKVVSQSFSAMHLNGKGLRIFPSTHIVLSV